MVHPHQTAGFAHPRRNVFEFGIEPGMVVADFGSGSGAYTLEMAELLKDTGTVYSVDVQKDLLRKTLNDARAKDLKNVEVLWGNVEKPHGSKLGDESVDLVLISNLLFQVEHKEGVLKEARRVLKSGGTLALIDWSESFGGLGPIRDHVFSQEHAQAMALDAGFTLIRNFPAGAHHYGLLFRRALHKKIRVHQAQHA